MGRGGHQEQVARQPAKELGQVVTLGVFDLAPEHGCRQLVSLVEDDEVPACAGHPELGLDIGIPRELVEAGDDEIVFDEPVPGSGRFEVVVGDDLEGQVELVAHLILPLFGKAAGADDEAPLDIGARDEFLDK